jgi:hypothetical protein
MMPCEYDPILAAGLFAFVLISMSQLAAPGSWRSDAIIASGMEPIPADGAN